MNTQGGIQTLYHRERRDNDTRAKSSWKRGKCNVCFKQKGVPEEYRKGMDSDDNFNQEVTAKGRWKSVQIVGVVAVVVERKWW